MGSRLLVVEDNPSSNFAIRAFFESAGYEVDAVTDAGSAAKLIDERRYDVVITDLHLSAPDSGEGMEIVSQTRRRSANACIIMLTAFGTAAAEIEARRRGADLFTAKPVALRDVSTFIDRVLRRDATAVFPAMSYR